ncbi:MAG: hypothetical protein AAGA48_40940, partial [Myxococcota bacterium]
VEFKRGFLHAGNVIATRREAQELGEHPRWRTADALSCNDGAFFAGKGVANLRCAGTKFALREVEGGEMTWVRRRGGNALKTSVLRVLHKLGVVPPWQVLQLGAFYYDLPAGLSLPHTHTLLIADSRFVPNLTSFRGLRHLVMPLNFLLEPLPLMRPLERITFMGQHVHFAFDAASPQGRVLSLDAKSSSKGIQLYDRGGLTSPEQVLERLAAWVARGRIPFRTVQGVEVE